MEKLLGFNFEWVLPGHGQKANLPAAQMRKELEKLVRWMKAPPEGGE